MPVDGASYVAVDRIVDALASGTMVELAAK